MVTGGSGPLIQKLKEAGVTVIPIDSLSNEVGVGKELKTLKELWTIIRRERPDIFHVNSSKAGIMGALVGRILRVKKIVFTAHGWAFNEDRPIYQRVALKWMHWLTIVFSHATIAVSQNIKDAFKGWLRVDGKIVVIHNGVKSDTSYGKSGARQALVGMFPQLKTALTNKNIFWVGTIAELHPVKNLDVALQAIKLLVSNMSDKDSAPAKPANQHFLYTIMGEGRERTRLENIIAKLGLSEHVFLLGHVADAFQYIKAFDAFLLPSRSEALAYVILETGMQETPVIATAVGGIPEIIDDMKSGVLVLPGKSAEIAHAIRFYADHSDTAREYAKALNEKVKRDFSLEKMVKETEMVYRGKVSSNQ